MEEFFEHLQDRLILVDEGPDKVRQGLLNIGNFNIKEVIKFQGEYHRLPREEWWSRLWYLHLWQKITTFLWLLLHH